MSKLFETWAASPNIQSTPSGYDAWLEGKTFRHVKAAQNELGVQDDGWFGPQSLAAVERLVDASERDKPTTLTPFQLAQRYIGIKELSGDSDHPLIRWWHSLCGFDAASVHDEVPWCSSFVNGICWELRLPRSKSALARSWLNVGTPVDIDKARPGYDVVIFSRPPNPASGHVAFFAGIEGGMVMSLGGNQDNQVKVAPYLVDRVLGVRRLA